MGVYVMKDTMMGLIDATTVHDSLQSLTIKRSLAAIPFGGRYRLIDFALSNLVNSGISSVAIFPKHQYRSLMDHLGSGKQWDLNRKRDGLFFFPPTEEENNSIVNEFGSFSHMQANIDYFLRSTQEYVVITNCNTVCNIDYRKVLLRHKQSRADITKVKKNGIPLHMYLLKKDFLLDLFCENKQSTYTHFMEVMCNSNLYKIQDYEYDGYVAKIDSIEAYYNHSLQLLDHEVWMQLFLKDRPIHTKVKDEPPTRYLEGATVKNSIIANGCTIEGHVENSILFRAVKVGKGTVIKNSVIMQKSHVLENCYLDTVILDKDVKVDSNVRLHGEGQKPYVLQKGAVQGALMSS
jgi:glucose-1-phosphate adenylyltransferase